MEGQHHRGRWRETGRVNNRYIGGDGGKEGKKNRGKNELKIDQKHNKTTNSPLQETNEKLQIYNEVRAQEMEPTCSRPACRRPTISKQQTITALTDEKKHCISAQSKKGSFAVDNKDQVFLNKIYFSIFYIHKRITSER